jgi:hypothetical protein
MLSFGVAGFPAGIAFQLYGAFDPARGLPLDPPGFTGFTLTLPYTDWLTFAGPQEVFSVYLMNSFTPAPWSDSNRPTTTGATLIQSYLMATQVSPIVATVPTALVRSYTSDPRWRGRLAFVLSGNIGIVYVNFATNENPTAALRPTLTAEQFSFTTGLTTHEIDRPGRIRTCARTGILAFADEFVEDGYVRGLMVHESAYDPEDLSDRQVVPASEGTVNDEVP